MKTIKAEVLDKLLYADRSGVSPVMDKNEHATVRKYIIMMLDAPSHPKPITRDVSRKIDQAYASLNTGGNAVFDDAVVEYLKTLVDNVGVLNKFIFDDLVNAIDGAVDYKPEAS